MVILLGKEKHWEEKQLDDKTEPDTRNTMPGNKIVFRPDKVHTLVPDCQNTSIMKPSLGGLPELLWRLETQTGPHLLQKKKLGLMVSEHDR